MTAWNRMLTFCLLFGLGCVAMGCGSGPVAMYVDPGFKASPPKTIRLMPVVDARKDKTTAQINLEHDIRVAFADRIRSHGFVVEMVDWPAQKPVPPASEVAAMESPDLAPYLPPGDDPVLLVTLDDASFKYVVLAKTAQVKISARAIEPARRRLLWKHFARANEGQGGLVSGLLPLEAVAVSECLDAMADVFPKHQNK